MEELCLLYTQCVGDWLLAPASQLDTSQVQSHLLDLDPILIKIHQGALLADLLLVYIVIEVTFDILAVCYVEMCGFSVPTDIAGKKSGTALHSATKCGMAFATLV